MAYQATELSIISFNIWTIQRTYYRHVLLSWNMGTLRFNKGHEISAKYREIPPPIISLNIDGRKSENRDILFLSRIAKHRARMNTDNLIIIAAMRISILFRNI